MTKGHWWLAAFLVSGLLWLAILGGLRSCLVVSDPQTKPVASVAQQTPSVATAAATASAAAVAQASQSVRITVRKRRGAGKDTRSVVGPERVSTPLSSSVDELEDGEDAVTIEVFQTIAAQATTSAQAESSARVGTSEVAQRDHGRLGVLIGTVPGLVAASYTLADVEIPPWVANINVRVGVDAEANLDHVGVALTAGGKGYVAGVAWTRWSLREQGLGLAIGLRF